MKNVLKKVEQFVNFSECDFSLVIFGDGSGHLDCDSLIEGKNFSLSYESVDELMSFKPKKFLKWGETGLEILLSYDEHDRQFQYRIHEDS